MPKTAKELREEQGKLFRQMEEHRDKITRDDYKFSAEDETIWQRMNTEYDERQAQIRQIEAMDDIASKRNAGGNPRENGDLRDDTDGRTGRGDQRQTQLTFAERATAIDLSIKRFAGCKLDPAQRALVQRARAAGVVALSRKGLDIRLGNPTPQFRQYQQARREGRDVQLRDLAFGDGSGNAGTLGPDGFIASLQQNMLYHGPMMQIATVLITDNGRKATLPTFDDTGNEGALVSEAASVSATADPTISELEWSTYKLKSGKVKYSAESEEDAVFDLPALLGQACGERLGRGANRYWTTGTGSSQPQGAVIGAGTGVSLSAGSYGSDNKLLADAFISLYHSVDPAYRTVNGQFMLHDSILSIARKLKNTAGDYLFRWREGIGDTIFVGGVSRPYSVNNHMDDTIANTKNIAVYGDFSKFWVRIVRTIRIRRFVELHGDNDQDAIQAFMRIGSRVVNAGTNPLKKIAVIA